MNTQTDSIRIAARDLQVGDLLNGARVTRRDDLTTPGVVYVWIDDNDRIRARADMIFHHGDRIRIERAAAAEQTALEADLDAAERRANGPGASGILYPVRDPGEDMADRWNETQS